MAKSLVIVESPAKAKTISRFLGKDFEVAASVGHIRDLPESASDIPARVKNEAWARLGVDTTGGYTPLYVIPAEKKEQVRKLKTLLEGVDALYLATDEDREGESISWHLREVLKPQVPVHRLVFHEITQEAIQHALAHPRSIDEKLVNAQEARRILDRLYGYEVSPLLWKKIRPRLSAGRVQSVAVRLVVEREQARMSFRASSYAGIRGMFEAGGGPFPASLVAVDGRPVAFGHDFDPRTGHLKAGSKALHLDEKAATAICERITGKSALVDLVEEKAYKERPAPPFITSTLQQEANRKLRWSARRTMQVAQRLYEEGWITYMRTDSTTLSEEAISAARNLIRAQYGADFVPRKPRTYKSEAKNAQEAHEAIRPAGSAFRSISEASAELGADEARLYELIWKRTVASQMPDAEGTRVKVRLAVDGTAFQATGKTISFQGFRRVYVESQDEEAGDRDDADVVLPKLALGSGALLVEATAQGHTTLPPPRLTEATLVKELEARGIGRPSTYATIIETIQARNYVFKKGNALVPTFTAFAVTNLLVETLSDLVDYAFTARMEDDLDRIAVGDLAHENYLRAFYEGASDQGLKTRVQTALSSVDARKVCTIPIGSVGTFTPIHVRVGRYGPFLEVDDRRIDIPEDLPPDELDASKALGMVEDQKKWPRVVGVHPMTRIPVLVMTGPYGFYVQEGEKPEKGTARRAGLLKGMDPETLDLDSALQLLSLPRELGPHPKTGEPVQALTGRFGPYLKCGATSRSVPEGMSVLTITLEEAVQVLEAPANRRASQRGPSRELGPHPETGKPVRVQSGRFGPYVSDGTSNASLPKNKDPESLTLEQALDLLREKAASPPRPGRPRGKATRSRTPSRTPPKTRSTKKTRK